MKRNNIDQLLHLLNVTFEVLPIASSAIAYEIILIAMKYHNDGNELPLKVIFSNKNFTEMGARSHLNRLEKSGWLDIVKSNQDLRVKVIKPTPKLVHVYQDFLSRIEN